MSTHMSIVGGAAWSMLETSPAVLQKRFLLDPEQRGVGVVACVVRHQKSLSRGGSKKTSRGGSKKTSRGGSKNTIRGGSKKTGRGGSKKTSRGGSKKTSITMRTHDNAHVDAYVYTHAYTGGTAKSCRRKRQRCWQSLRIRGRLRLSHSAWPCAPQSSSTGWLAVLYAHVYTRD